MPILNANSTTSQSSPAEQVSKIISSDTPKISTSQTKAAVADTLAQLGLAPKAPIIEEAPNQVPDPTVKPHEMAVSVREDPISVSGDEDAPAMIEEDEGVQIQTPEVEAAPEDPGVKDQLKKLRRERLAAQKAQRKLDEERKTLRVQASQVQQFQQGLQQVDTDPTALLKAAGLDPTQYGQKLMGHFLQTEKPVDPIVEKLKPYIEGLENERQSLLQKQLMIQESNMIAGQVMPTLSTHADRFETLIATEGGIQQAAIKVFNVCKDAFQQCQAQGVAFNVSFEEAADQLEKYYSDQVNVSINKIKSMKKYASEFGTAVPIEEKKVLTSPVKPKPASTEPQKQQSQTLTNKQSLSVTPAPVSGKLARPKKFEPGDRARVSETLAQLGLDPQGRRLRK